MTHDVLGLDDFLAEVSKAEEQKTHLLRMQREELKPGCWAIQLSGFRAGKNPLSWRPSVFYIYDQQDYVALAAMQGGDAREMMEEAQAQFEAGRLRGREYSDENPGGELTEVSAAELIPITEEQAAEVRFYEFKLPIIMGMCDWFEPMIERVSQAFATEGVGPANAQMITCPRCGNADSVRTIVQFTGNGLFFSVRTDEKIVLVRNEAVSVTSVAHLHQVCGVQECDYDECIDLNEVEIDTSHL